MGGSVGVSPESVQVDTFLEVRARHSRFLEPLNLRTSKAEIEGENRMAPSIMKGPSLYGIVVRVRFK